MAFFLEERDAKFLTDSQTPAIGPGQYYNYNQHSAFGALRNAHTAENTGGGSKMISIKRPGFN